MYFFSGSKLIVAQESNELKEESYVLYSSTLLVRVINL